jgi:DNA-directed RNA polymerase specialized sigma24 family protein
LRCPFGCRRHHRREEARKRSAAYRRTPGGKRQKKLLNARRQQGAGSADRPPEPDIDPHPQATPPSEPTADAPQRPVELPLEGVVLDESSVAGSRVLPYVRMVVSLIEGVEFTFREIAELLRLAMRQHSIGAPGRSPYAWCFPPQRPP